MFSTLGIQHQAETAGPTNFGGTIYVFSFVAAFSTAFVTFGSNGVIEAGKGFDPFGYSSVISNTLSGTNWYQPNQTNIGNSFYIRATLSSGQTPNGTLGSWQQLNTDRTWSLSSTEGTVSSNLLIQIATDAIGSNIVASGTVEIISDVYTGGGNIP